MLKYQVIEEATLSHLITRVELLIAKGFEPIGGVAVIRSGEYHYTRFYQAMIKEDRKLFAEKLKAAQRKGWTLDEVIANTMNETLEEANAEEG